MRILFTRFPLESLLGGAEIQTLTLMEGLRRDGHDVSFLGSCPTLLAECKKRGIPATELEIGPPPVTVGHAISFSWRRYSMISRLKTQESRLNVDAVFMLSLSEKLLLTDTLTKRGTKVFWIEHDRVGRWLSQNPWLSRLRKMSSKAITIAVSELSKQIYVALGFASDRIISIPNGIDFSRFTADKEGSQPSNAALRVGTVARLSPEKGIDVLLDSITALPGISMEIIGIGSEATLLQKQIDTIADREGNLRIRLQPSTNDLGGFYRSLDVFVLPSRDHDPFGLVAAEAMSLGIATIVTDVCGIAGYLQNGRDALVVKAGSMKELTRAISSLQDATLRHRIGDEGRKTAHERFSAEAMVEAYERLLG